tara:strand:- start:450 stop:1637 length:1188 start_codon:yes stop_codon:yes gene_type:complete
MTTLTTRYNPPYLYRKQRLAIFDDSRYAIIEGATKSGKTVACLSWIIYQAINGKAGKNYWWIAPVYPQAKIAYRRIKRAMTKRIYVANEAELTITMRNGSIISFKSAEKPDNLYGEDVYGAVLDEATRMREESWHAIRSTLTATGGKVRIIGNVKGRRNWAYRLSRQAEAGVIDWHYSKLTAWDAVEGGIVSEAEIKDAQNILPEPVFRELYLAEASDDGGNPFGISSIESCITNMSKEKPVYWGIDLAKSQDYTVIIGLDMNGRVSYFDRFQQSWESTERTILQTMNGETCYVDSTGVGDPIVERLQKNLSNFHGYKFSSPSKQRLMEGLQLAIHNKEIGFPEGTITQELLSFEYQYTRTGATYSAPTGLHDDCVMALSLAVYGKDNRAGLGVW